MAFRLVETRPQTELVQSNLTIGRARRGSIQSKRDQLRGY